MTILTLIFISYFSANERELTQATVKNDKLSSLERNKSFRRSSSFDALKSFVLGELIFLYDDLWQVIHLNAV